MIWRNRMTFGFFVGHTVGGVLALLMVGNPHSALDWTISSAIALPILTTATLMLELRRREL